MNKLLYKQTVIVYQVGVRVGGVYHDIYQEIEWKTYKTLEKYQNLHRGFDRPAVYEWQGSLYWYEHGEKIKHVDFWEQFEESCTK